MREYWEGEGQLFFGAMSMTARPLLHWLLLFALVLLWGSSFLLNKLALQAFTPSALVAARLALGAVVLVALLVLLGRAWPRGGRLWRSLIALAVVGNCLPFWLISWGQQEVDSGLAGILMAVMPLTTVVLAHVFIAGERMTGLKLGGFLLGFLGIVVLTGPEALLEFRGEGTLLWYQLAVLGGAICYAVNTIIARRRPPCEPLAAAAGITLASAAIMALPGAHTSWPALSEIPQTALWGVLLLGLFSTALATVIYLRLIALAGPSFVALINYLIPPYAVLAGWVLLGEQPDASALAALALILGGIAVSEIGTRKS